ncbi:MAG: hypothetical protein CMA86_01180 [Euryarchaeota archaeon]|nr:hypothetical protein [Euryarchaeota archaeon]
MLTTAAFLLATSMLPGWALASVLDGTGDRLRKALLAPALGLLLLYGINGALLVLGVWTPLVVWLCVLMVNGAAYRLINTRHEVLAKRSRWQLLEAAMHGEVSEETDAPSLSKEAETQLAFQERRSMPLFMLGILVACTALLSPLLQSLPFGVDWIGFAMLTQQMMLENELVLSGTNEGFWTYPPAFPSLAGWLGASAGLNAGIAVFHLGHYTLFVLLLGMMGALDRHGAGGYAMLAMGLGIGLFAKTFDSGYPSVASQLGMVVGILVLFRPVEQRQKLHTLGLCIALVCVGLTHPTGAIYLALLMLSHVLHGITLENEEHRALAQKFAYITSAFITVGFSLALIVIAPRLFDEAVFSEYGWQGGKPMLVYNGPLLFVATFAATSLRKTLEGRILVTWFAMLWLLSLVHLIEGLQHIPVLSLLSYTLYSMALHAFHVPLAVLVALWWSSGTELTPHHTDANQPTWSIPQPVGVGLAALVVMGAIAAQSVAFTLSEHDELLAVSPGDLELRQALNDIQGSVYTENMHWGYVWDAPADVQTTSIPTLGLVHLTASEQSRATAAIFADNITYFEEHSMLHALTSPLGTMQWTLASSPYWQPLVESDGAKLWELKPLGDAKTATLSGIDEEDCDACVTRMDPWRNHKFRDPLQLGEDRPFLAEGTEGLLTLEQPAGARKMCLVYEVVGTLEGLYLQSATGLEQPFHGLRTDAGYHQACFSLEDDASLASVELTWKRDEPQRWINPMGLSGRDNVLLDSTGVKLQWLEWHA